MNDNIVNATMTEAGAKPDENHALARLLDWQSRVHTLYDLIQKSLGDQYSYDRSGKQVPNGDLVQRAGIKPGEIPALDSFGQVENRLNELAARRVGPDKRRQVAIREAKFEQRLNPALPGDADEAIPGEDEPRSDAAHGEGLTAGYNVAAVFARAFDLDARVNPRPSSSDG